MVDSVVFTHQQQVALAITPVVSGVISAFGSFSILYIILRDRKSKLRQSYHRIMLGMSAADLIASLTFATSTFLMPRDTPGVWGAKGNRATCSLQGFFTQYTYIPMLYSGVLAAHFLRSTKSQHRSVGIQTQFEYWEPMVHSVIWLFNISAAFAGLALKLYNPPELGVGCYISQYPKGCAENSAVFCERGEHSDVYRWVFGGMLVMPVGALIIYCMIAIYLSVRKQLGLIERRYSTAEDQNCAKKRLRVVERQGMLYIFSVVGVYLWSGVTGLLENGGNTRRQFFVIALLAEIFLPSQGTFNFFIFVFPLYRQLRSDWPQDSQLETWKRIYHVMWTPTSTRRNVRSLIGVEIDNTTDVFQPGLVLSNNSSQETVGDREVCRKSFELLDVESSLEEPTELGASGIDFNLPSNHIIEIMPDTEQ